MKMTKGNEPSSKSGGMKSHLGASPGNNPTTSKKCDLSFSGKNFPKGSSSERHKVASSDVGSGKSGMDSDGDYDNS